MAIDGGRQDLRGPPRVVTVTLLGAVIVIFASGFSATFTYSGAEIRDRIFYGAERGAGIFPALLGLAAALILVWYANLDDGEARWTAWSRAGVTAISGVVISASIFSIWYVLSLHVHIPGPNSSAGLAISFGERAWSEKLTQIFQELATLLVGGAALVVVRRARPHVRIRSSEGVATVR